jgi:uncharacterized protein (DUF433 family)
MNVDYKHDQCASILSPRESRMTDKELLERITVDPEIMVGKPII